MLLDLKKAKKAELEAEIALYKEAGIEDITENLDTNKALVAEIERLQGLHGFPLRIDAELIANEPVLAKFLMEGENGAKEGDLVFAEQADLDEVEKIIAESTKPVVPVKTDNSENTKVEPEPAKSAEQVDLVYIGKTVVGIANVIVSGKSYKDVSVASGETFRLSEQEFNNDVKPRE